MKVKLAEGKAQIIGLHVASMATGPRWFIGCWLHVHSSSPLGSFKGTPHHTFRTESSCSLRWSILARNLSKFSWVRSVTDPFHHNKKQNTNKVSILSNKGMEGSLRVIKAFEGVQTDSIMTCPLSPWMLTQYVCQVLKLHACAWTLKPTSPGRRVLCPLPANQQVKMLWCTNTQSELQKSQSL